MNLQDDYDYMIVEGKFPHIARRLVTIWGTVEAREYLRELVVCARPNRQGFPPDVFMSLSNMLDIHLKAHPPVSTSDPWSQIN